MLLKNRYDAALQLIPLLDKYKGEAGVVLAIPRGGVPLGYYISKRLNFPLGLLLTKKIGHPLNKEFAIGAVSLEDELIEYRENISDEYLRNEINNIRESLKVRFEKFMGSQPVLDLENKVVIIVDDGIATGNTILAAIKLMREKNPKKIVVAVPIVPSRKVPKIREVADEFLFLFAPENFRGVGQFYYDFSEVSDEDVKMYLKEANDLYQTV